MMSETKKEKLSLLVRRLLALILFCASCTGAQVYPVGRPPFPISGGSFTPLAYVQDTSTVTGANPYTIAFTTANNTAGNTSCVGITFRIGTGTTSVSSVTSAAGNTYTAVTGSLSTVAATDWA